MQILIFKDYCFLQSARVSSKAIQNFQDITRYKIQMCRLTFDGQLNFSDHYQFVNTNIKTITFWIPFQRLVEAEVDVAEAEGDEQEGVAAGGDELDFYTVAAWFISLVCR